MGNFGVFLEEGSNCAEGTESHRVRPELEDNFFEDVRLCAYDIFGAAHEYLVCLDEQGGGFEYR
jgi:hypothetical protein